MQREGISAGYLRSLLRTTGLTQAAAAQLVGVSLRTMQRYLTDAHADHISTAGLIVLQQSASMKSTCPVLITSR